MKRKPPVGPDPRQLGLFAPAALPGPSPAAVDGGRLEPLRAAVRAALGAGLFIGSGAWGVAVLNGRWQACSPFVCPLGALLLGRPGKAAQSPSEAAREALGGLTSACSLAAGYDGWADPGIDPDAYALGRLLRAELPPMR